MWVGGEQYVHWWDWKTSEELVLVVACSREYPPSGQDVVSIQRANVTCPRCLEFVRAREVIEHAKG